MLSTILLQAAQQGSGWSSMFLILAMIVIFYFFMIRPQSKKQKEIKRQREAMKAGDKVVTAGGIHGKIREVKENALMIDVAPNITLKIDKNSVYPIIDDVPAK